MTEGWDNYFFMIGSSAAALIGLMFVVVTLTAGHDRGEVERGKQLYTSPIVFHLAVVLVLSGLAVVPKLSPKLFGAAIVVVSLMGLLIGLRSTFGIRRLKFAPDSTAFDMVWYGLAPAIVYAISGLSGAAMFEGVSWAMPATAALVMALLLVSIHAEWDLVTYLAPTAQTKA